MSPLYKKLIRDLAGQALPAITATFVIGLGIATLVGFLGTYRDLDGSRESYYTSQRYMDVRAILERAPGHLVDEIRRFPGVDRAEGRIVEIAPLDLPGLDQRLTAEVVSIPEHRPPMVNQLLLVEGRLPRPGRIPEVVVGEPFAAARGLSVGDPMYLMGGGRRRTVTIVGLAQSPEFVFVIPFGGGLIPEPENFAIVWAR
jgi:putative ABC transport system permease protein